MDFRDRILQARNNANKTFGNAIHKDLGSPFIPDNICANNNESDIEDFEFYGALRIGSYVFNLELFLSDGSRAAVPYSLMANQRFSPAKGITFIAAGEKYTITGRNLEPIWNRLLAHRLRYVRANIGSDLTPENQLFVCKIILEEI